MGSVALCVLHTNYLSLTVLTMNEDSFFYGRTLCIATMHRKESVIAPILNRELGVHCITTHIDTDQLGTFSGETPRTQDPLATARLKCDLALAYTGGDLAVASEGSFGPHPVIGFVPADEEWLLLRDQRHDLEIHTRVLSTDTNYGSSVVTSLAQLTAFATRAGFPSHALILRKDPHAFDGMVKGITTSGELKQVFESLMATYGKAYVETDMRALYNPSRMKVISEATEKLVQALKSTCPECRTPGFVITDAREGLPCALCRRATRSTIAHISTCRHCGYFQETMYPHQKHVEDPMYCDYCNP